MWDCLKTNCKPGSICFTGQIVTRNLAPNASVPLNRVMPAMPKVEVTKGDIDFEGYGTALGGVVAAGIYVFTYPIVWIDGPLPFVDSAWLLGLGAVTYRGARIGGSYGRALDQVESLVR